MCLCFDGDCVLVLAVHSKRGGHLGDLQLMPDRTVPRAAYYNRCQMINVARIRAGMRGRLGDRGKRERGREGERGMGGGEI